MLRALNPFASEILVNGELFTVLECGHYMPLRDAEHDPDEGDCIPADEQWCKDCDRGMCLPN